MKSSDELKQELIDKLVLLKQLKVDLTAKNFELSEIESKIDELTGTYAKAGTIMTLRRQILDALRYEAEMQLPRVIWDGDSVESNFVVTKVTRKRIYIKEPGTTIEYYYDKKTGIGPTYSNKINVVATLESFTRKNQKTELKKL